MYKRMRLADTVRIAPELLGEPVEEAVKLALRDKLEGLVDKNIGSIVAVTDVIEVGEGHILAGDAGVYYDAIFDAVTFMPELQEIIEGSVLEVVEFGVFAGIGPLDGLVHVSQLTDEYVSYDERNSRLITKESGRAITVGDRIRARIVAVSLNEREPRDSKIGLTMRQHALGKLEWLEEARQGRKEGTEEKEAKPRKRKKEEKKEERKEEEKKEDTVKEEKPEVSKPEVV
ncbi:DNA-directed RNA polymerase subunit E' [Candidatus Methanoperedens nitroreducens]|uniref:DNA-directed RNA polymerase subunit Rpo7 n=1 Tax=Candidatus Methanoperedens nitratireducens TaxID=1392998 RepID=A0A062V6E1_9EURY|nr:DNA-directed RNA polymerase [Candidatus Methanoperedens nitroreducens]KCZ70925.1 DNA-directed RNA polymerase subunit E' [Candidatus Methanoperedens nitroreducens]